MVKLPVPRFVRFAQRLTLTSGLSMSLVGAAACGSGSASDQDAQASNHDVQADVDDNIHPPGVVPYHPDAAAIADTHADDEDAQTPEPDARFITGVLPAPSDASADARIHLPGVVIAPEDASVADASASDVPLAGGPLSPPDMPA